MAIKTYRPTTPGRRGMTTRDFSSVTTSSSVKSLKKIKKQNSGRNNSGRITVRHRGGGAKRFYRLVNYKAQEDFTGTIEAIEYDPNRSANIARVKDDQGKYHYVLAASSYKVGQQVHGGQKAPIEAGNRLPLSRIPTGTQIYNIELKPGRGGQLVRTAGAQAQLVAKEGTYAQVRLPSGEIRLIHLDCSANIGNVGNEQHQNVKLGSAGRVRRMGCRPQVRGKAMNAVDHPHGGGDGGAHGIGRNPKTPWGQPTLGYKTRRRKSTNNMIVRTRHKAKR